MGTYTITSSTELMENYLQTAIMAPERQLQALQDPAGHLLLFSIGSDHAGAPLNLTAEVPSERHGWRTINLTAALAGPCRRFSAAQRSDGSIRLAVVLRTGTQDKPGDTLYLAELAAVASGDLRPPSWTAVPYDDPATPRPQLEIAGVSSSEASTGGYTIADVVRSPGSATKEIVRYFIDPSRPDGHVWRLHDVPVDIEAGNYASAVGRKADTGVDGVYVSGQINGKPQIVYTPLFNELRHGSPPLSAYLRLTAAGDLIADAIATCRLPDGSTDLYATAKGVLYRFASDNQKHQAVAVPVLTSPAFGAVTDLYACHDPATDTVTVWGRNTDNAILATTYAVDASSKKKQWSVPLPLLTGVQQVSPLLNRADGANTIVAHTAGDDLRIGVKSAGTGAWSWRPVTLPPAAAATPAQKINSYTTKIEVRDQDNQPAPRLALAVSAASRTAVYINHLYYVVGPMPIRVPTDAAGTVTIVEAVPRLTGARFTVTIAGDTSGKPTEVNPMDKPFKLAASLNTVQGLRDAKITSYLNGTRQPPRDLLKPGVSTATLERVADLNKKCAAIYADPQKKPEPALLAATAVDAEPFDVPPDAPVVSSGDLFQHLEAETTARRLRAAETGELAAGESFWQMLVRWFEEAWEFVVKIGEAIYRCILKVVEDVVAAIRWVFDKIVEAIEDLIEFLRFLFEWDDFTRTKAVFKNVTRLFLDHQCDQLVVVRKDFDATIESIIQELDRWSGLDDLPGLGDAGTGRLSHQATQPGPGAPQSLMIHHFQGNVHSGTYEDGPPSGQQVPGSVLEVLEQALAAAEKALGKTQADLRRLVQAAPGMTLVDILKAIVGIIGDTVLRGIRVVVDALLDAFILLARAAVDALDSPIHIPVISDILNAIGVPDVSMLDIVCWVAAVPVTIGYKIGAALAGRGQRAPFPDSPVTTFLSEVKDFPTLAAGFGHRQLGPQTVDASAEDAAGTGLTGAGVGPIDISPEDAEIVSIVLHGAAGICGGVSAFVDAEESLLPTAKVPMWLSAATIASAVVGGGSRAAANVLVPHDPLNNLWARYYNAVFSGFFLLNKGFWGFQGYFQAPTDTSDYRFRGAVCDAVLVIPALVITCVHLAELAKRPESKDRTMAILDETSYLSTYIGRVLYTMIVTGVFDADEEVKIGVAAVMGVTSIVHGVLQLSEATVEGTVHEA